MIEIKIDPIIFHLGSLFISWHGIWLALGILASYFTFQRLGEKASLPEALLAELPLAIFVFGFILSRFSGLFDDWQYYFSNPAKFIAITSGGLTVTEGILGGILAAFLYAKLRRVQLSTILDLLSISALMGDITGRVGCTILWDVYGIPTGGSWGLVYLHPDSAVPAVMLGVPAFPALVAFIVWDLIILVLLFWFRRKSLPQGSLFILFLSLYRSERLIITFWQPRGTLWLGMSFIQWIGVLIISMAVITAFKVRMAESERWRDWAVPFRKES